MKSKPLIFIFLLGLGIPAFYQFSSKFLSQPEEKSQGILNINQESKEQIGHYPAPNFTLEDLGGNEINLSSFRGENLLLVFWTTWCSWCTKEKPFLKEFATIYEDKIKVIGINIKESKELVKKHVEELQLNFPTLLDKTGKVAEAYNVRTHPSHFLIDGEGKIRATRPGFATLEDLRKLAEQIPR